MCVTFFAAILVLGTRDGRVHIEHAIIVVSISVVVGAEGTVDAVSLQAVVEAHGLAALVTLGEASVTVGATCVRGHLPFKSEVCFEEGSHRNNIFAVVFGAANTEVIKTAIARAEAEADKVDVLDLAIGRVHSSATLNVLIGVLVLTILLFIVIFLDPLSNGAAAQELDGVTSNPRHVIVVVAVPGVSIFELTSVGNEVTAHGGV